MAYVFLVALVLIMIGELADKSQLLALVLATRYKTWQVLLGIFGATLVVHFFTALVGQFLGGALPNALLPWISGLLFVGFGIWTLRGDNIEASEADRGAKRFGPVLATAVAFFFAELGDKTQIMTLTIAADPGSALLVYLKGAGPMVQGWLGVLGSADTAGPMARFWAVTLGSTVGMVLADAVAILIGRALGKKLPELLMRRVSGAIFIAFGLLTITSVFLGG
ncbi:MAG: TMEM165/GDT1 family protein [Actinomycetota bacterium]|nr:TMEM165/GDT1 family protein [Actinomycetota bacterium]